jgi:hypothetical protein
MQGRCRAERGVCRDVHRSAGPKENEEGGREELLGLLGRLAAIRRNAHQHLATLERNFERHDLKDGSQFHASWFGCAVEPTPPQAQLGWQFYADWLRELIHLGVRQRLPSRREPGKLLVAQAAL